MGYVTFADPENAVVAYTALDKKSFQGRLLHILPAVDRRGRVTVEEIGKKTLKEEREAKKKATAGREFNWSMLYMNVCTFYTINRFLSLPTFAERCRRVFYRRPYEHLQG